MRQFSSLQKKGILFIVSGPSGSGKTTLCERLQANKEAYYAISCTTRSPRPGEENGKDYFFLSQEQFKQKIETNAFLEYAEVHGNFYGTLKSEIVKRLELGLDVVMDIDVKGADLIRSCDDALIQSALVDVFITPKNEEELEKRLVGRATDAQEIIAKRLKNALGELQHHEKYSYLLVSGEKESDYSRFFAILQAERLKQSRFFTVD